MDDFTSNYEIYRSRDFIRANNFTRVALQFPDSLLKDATRVAKALKQELENGVRFFVMADTAYGSCCVDEVVASHVDADCVVHYGHACMSPMSTLPALFVFGKAGIDVNDCTESLFRCLLNRRKHVLVLIGLEYAHALEDIKSVVANTLPLDSSETSIHYAEVVCSIMNPSEEKTSNDLQSHTGVITDDKLFNSNNIKTIPSIYERTKMDPGTIYRLGGLTWHLPVGRTMEDYLLFWIGSDDPAFANVVLTFNNCDVVRYDAKQGKLLDDFSSQKRILKRRYFLVEKAKDANIVGILVGTLGVAGYLHMIRQMKELIEGAGKKSYTLVMGRPNAAKLANFPECDVFVYVSCAQTALLDSKEFLAPVITPFEALLAFSSGRQWTGEYVMEFRDLINSATSKAANSTEEARFSFIQGGYVEEFHPQGEGGERKESSLDLVEATEKALNLKSQTTDSILFKGTAKTGAEFFAARSYQGLNAEYENPINQSYIIGRTGRASGYEHEKNKMAVSCREKF